jgi:hypothetical protein
MEFDCGRDICCGCEWYEGLGPDECEDEREGRSPPCCAFITGPETRHAPMAAAITAAYRARRWKSFVTVGFRFPVCIRFLGVALISVVARERFQPVEHLCV